MFLYWLASENRYVHRQADVPKGVDSERVDVPTDTAGLMGYLNNLVLSRSGTISIETPSETPIVPERESPPMDAGAVLSRIDSPGVDVEGVVEAIAKAKGYALRRYAGAVAVRFQELGKL